MGAKKSKADETDMAGKTIKAGKAVKADKASETDKADKASKANAAGADVAATTDEPPASAPPAPKAKAKGGKKKPARQPVILEGRILAHTWWGRAWNANLERYADFSNRIGRGKTYVRKGAVVDLQLEDGLVKARVQGTRMAPYKIEVRIDPMPPEHWAKLQQRCAHRVDNLQELIEGRFPEELSDLFTRSGEGLFPTPREIHFSCSCPDWAYMCKHVAAVLYGIGARLDEDPLLFFALRQIDMGRLIKKSLDEKLDNMLANAGKISPRALSDDEAARLFGV